MNRKMIATFVVLISIIFITSTGCKNSSTPTEPPDTDTTYGGPVVRKPNIYIYPQSKDIISVKLEFPLGGTVIESEPVYNGEWIVEVEPSGKINNQYGYLYYESQTPDAYQYKSGWIIDRDSLLIFFRKNLYETGFNEREINDFLEYWIPKLTDYSYYCIYPQYSSDINKVIKLKIKKEPDSLLRLFYVIKRSINNEKKLVEPVIPKFERNGFVVAEWGVILE